jgi:hypothetical protein
VAFTKPSFNVYDKNLSNSKYRLQTAKFLKSFGSSHIFCYNGDPRKKISNMVHSSDINAATMHNSGWRDIASYGKSDVYFYVNGVRKQNEVKTFRACFIDLDAGRKPDGTYHEARTVVSKKVKMLEAINKFPVKPSWVVDTRNGYQIYWVLNSKSRHITASNWNGLQKKLVNYFKEFGADARGIKANQIYRVPYTWWFKVWEKKAPYFTSILNGSTGAEVAVGSLLEALDGQSTVVKIDHSKTSDHWFNKRRQESLAYSGKDHSTGVLPHKASDITEYKPITITGSYDMGDDKTALLKKTIDFLNQAATALHFSNNRFLSSSARELASQIGDKFCVG